MTVTLDLPPDLEQRLVEEAQRHGLSVDRYAMVLLYKSLPSQERSIQTIELLQSWIDDEDPEEQRETGAYLVRALDEERPSDRQLFPPELKGVTW